MGINDDRSMSDQNNSWGRGVHGSIGQINGEIDQENRSQGVIGRKRDDLGADAAERQRSSSIRAGGMSFFGQQQKAKVAKQSQFAVGGPASVGGGSGHGRSGGRSGG